MDVSMVGTLQMPGAREGSAQLERCLTQMHSRAGETLREVLPGHAQEG